MKYVLDAQGKVAIVTGAASGIGREIASELLAAGAHVVAADLDGAKLAEVFPQETFANVTTVAANVCVAGERKKILEAALVQGGVDYLVNSAGIVRTSDIFSVSEEEWDLIQNVNAKSCFFMCQLIGNYWRQNGETGAIVNFSSSAGKTASTTPIAPYNASKASVIAVTKSFAHALAPYACRVNCVCPGLINTPMQQSLKNGLSHGGDAEEAEVAKRRVAMVPLGREGNVEEVSRVVCFLLSDGAGYMTGQAVNITGGMVMY
ncbi:SDR family NAD(P)-dependent oxidoreductase [Brevibacillus sp. NRS-1366]|uniref:SDR family NAD(P)-dependent oxidoreductase n=1 Tax=Brevibacillus sp. NRS-1366 TaxID=3233899 RepID=UPI003D1F2EF6